MPHKKASPEVGNFGQGSFDLLPPEEGLALQHPENLTPEYFPDAQNIPKVSEETEPTRKELLEEILNIYAEKNSYRGRSSSLRGRIRDSVLGETYTPGKAEELEMTLGRTVHAVERSELDAQQLFGRVIDIDTYAGIEKRSNGASFPRIKTENPARQREFDVRYGAFKAKYEGLEEENKARRDAARAGEAAVVIPGYSSLNRAIDYVMLQKVEGQHSEPSEASEDRETTDSDAAEKQKLSDFYDALTVLGKRNQKIFHDGNFQQKTYSNQIPNLEEVDLPVRGVSEELARYCRRLSPNELAKFASELFTRAGGFESVRANGLLSEKEARDTEGGDFQLFWLLYSKRGEDVSDDRQKLKTDIKKQIHVIDQQSAKAGKQLSIHIE
jgi:hypothetical protein